MPVMQIQGSGGKTATLNIPDGATEEQIQAYAQRVKTEMEAKARPVPEDAVQSEQEDGVLVETARMAESALDNFVLDGAERMGLIDEIEKAEIPGAAEMTFDERVEARQQAMWDQVPATHKFLIGMGQSVDNLKDWGLGALGLGDEEARAAEDAVFRALDENNQDASDAGELLADVAQFYGGAGAVKGAGAALGLAFKFGRGSVGRAKQLFNFFAKYDPKTIQTVAKTKEGQNLLKAVNAGDDVAQVAAKGFGKKADAIDQTVRKAEALRKARMVNKNPKGKNPMELRAEMNVNVSRGTERAKAAQAEIKEQMATAQQRATEAAARLKAQKAKQAAEETARRAQEAARARQVDQASRRANATTASAKKPTGPRKSNPQSAVNKQVGKNRASNRKSRRDDLREAIKRSPGGF